MIVAIDGPAAAGKSSTARAVADRLGFKHVDSGALYRAATAARARRDGHPGRWTEAEVLDAANAVTLKLVSGAFVPHIEGIPVDDELRNPTVTAAVPRVAQMPGVRAWVNARVRDAAAFQNVVVDGRDMGTAVFPHAEVKVYLQADARERARRRVLQLEGREPTEEEVQGETLRLEARDARDAAQSTPSSNAVRIDTTKLTQAQQIDQIVELARRFQKK